MALLVVNSSNNNKNETPDACSTRSTDTLENQESIELMSLEDECKRRAYLDGTWFVPDLSGSSPVKILANCQLCQRKHNKSTFISGPLASSSNFKTHLKRSHKDKVAGYEDYCLAKKRRLGTDEDNLSRRTYCKFSQQQHHNNVVNYITDTFAPYDTVESPSFRKIFVDLEIKQNGTSVRHMSTTTVTRRTEDSYKAKMSKIKEELSSVEYVSGTADVWTSRHRRFMGVTAHWIVQKTFKIVSYAIACRRFPGSHTHDKVAKILNDIYSQYGLTGQKLIATVTDNGSNFLKAFREFGLKPDAFQVLKDHTAMVGESESDSEMPDEDDRVKRMSFSELNSSLLPEHRRCASHTLNLIATTDTLKGINSNETIKLMYADVMKKCNILWSLMKSPKKFEIMHDVLGEVLKRPVVTRWNSLFDCFRQIIKLEDKIKIVFTQLELIDRLISSDFKFLGEYVQCNEPIAVALDLLQGENDVCYGYLLPIIISTRNRLQKLKDITFDYCEGLIPVLIGSLEKRFRNLFNLVEEGSSAAVAAATHPRFKLRWLHCLEEAARNEALEAVKQGMASCYQPPSQESAVEAKNINNDGFDFDNGNQNSALLQNTIGTNVHEQEFKVFCQDDKSDLSILHVYPIVKSTFIKFNTLLPSSASVERTFNLATMWNISRFNRLSNEHFEQRVLLKANPKF